MSKKFVFKTQKIQNLWQNQEYRNFQVTVLSYINRDTSVPADAQICWYKLFNIAYTNKNWSIQISKAALVDIFNRILWLLSIAIANSSANMFHVEREINQNHVKETKAPCSRYSLQRGLA